MKKILIVAVLFLSLVLTACGEAKKGIDKGKVIVGGQGVTDYDSSPPVTIDEHEPELILYGETVDYKGEMYGEGVIITREIIKPLEILKGTVDTGEVEVVKDGGYAIAQEFIDSYESEEDRESVREFFFQGVSDARLKDRYICQLGQNERDFDIGNKAIYILYKNEEGEYLRVGGKKGQYNELPNGLFMKQGIMEYSSAVDLIEEIDKNGELPSAYRNMGFDEMMQSLDEIKQEYTK